MNNENKAILKAEIIINESKFRKLLEEYMEGFYALFYLILKNPLDNIWWECISITIQYCQLLIFIINQTVSLIINILIIVYSSLESTKIIN
jgi:hypothetical protein